MKTQITKEEWLQAFALYTMAMQALTRVREYEKGIAVIFGDEQQYNEHMSDTIYGCEPQAPSEQLFAEVLKKNDISVMKEIRRRSPTKRSR